ncbi:MAG TPA: hypothetical protein PK176_11235 [Acidobacteriota bacterium]|mgnify:FL=1|nr:hypothetical protein [Acidobacteriota bacterium]HQM63877.1 hypothetical protein [Acidobacteriota bacterium]
MVRFLHTSDWQLGMRRHFLDEGAQERYAQARFDAVRALGRIAAAEECRVMLVCRSSPEVKIPGLCLEFATAVYQNQ